MNTRLTSEASREFDHYKSSELTLSATILTHIEKVAECKPIGRDAVEDLRELGMMVPGKYLLSERGKQYVTQS